MEFPITWHNPLKVNKAAFNFNWNNGLLKEFDFNLNCFGKIYLPKFSLCGISCNAESKEYRAQSVYMFVYISFGCFGILSTSVDCVKCEKLWRTKHNTQALERKTYVSIICMCLYKHMLNGHMATAQTFYW